jgi:hypothetical protein
MNRIPATVSRDDGKTWPVSKTLHEGPAAYSCLAVLPDKTIFSAAKPQTKPKRS